MGFSWTQPCCESCWWEHNPSRHPTTIVEAYREPEVCVHCGLTTRSGIYVRVDPETARHPTRTK